jgi:hypothetical protein
MALLLKLALMIGGAILIALGIVITPLPGPFGVPIILLGLAVLLRSSIWVKRQFVRLRAKHPKLLGPIRALLRPGAKILALLWLQALRAERAFMPKSMHGLYRLRPPPKGLFRRRPHAQRKALSY